MKYIKFFILSCMMISCSKYNKEIKINNRDIVYCSLYDSILAYSTFNSKEVIVENILSNKIQFKRNLKDICYLKPIIRDSKIYFPVSDEEFICHDLKSKKTLWKIKTSNKLCNIQILNNENLIINIKGIGFRIINIKTGKEEYQLDYVYDKNCLLPDSSPYQIVSDKNYFYISSWMCNAITKYRISNGEQIWKLKLEEATSVVSVLYKDKLFVGSNYSYESGFIRVIDAKTGKIDYQEKSNFEPRIQPLLKGDRIIYYTFDSALNEFNINNMSSKKIFKLSEFNDFSGAEMYLLDNEIFFQSPNYSIIYQFDLKTNKIKKIGKYEERMISGIYKNKVGKATPLW